MLGICFLPFLSSPPVTAQLDTRGKDFWFAYPINYTGASANGLSVIISAQQTTTGTVFTPSGPQPFTITVTPPATSGTATIIVNNAAEVSTPETAQLKAIHVVANNDVALYGFTDQSQTVDGFLGIPTASLGTEYYVMSYPGTAGVSTSGSHFVVVGTENGTTVTVTPSVTVGAHAAGVPFQFALQQGETWRMVGSATTDDLTGTKVTANHAIGLMAGNRCAYVPQGTAPCDPLLEMLPSTDTWGREFFYVPSATRVKGDFVRVLAARPNTVVNINGVNTTLQAGQFLTTAALPSAAHITSNEPVLVSQFITSYLYDTVTNGGLPYADPSMTLIPPQEQYLDAYGVATPVNANQVFTVNYVNLTIPTDSVNAGTVAGVPVSDVTVDGTAVPTAGFAQIGTSDYWYARVAVGQGAHTLLSSRPFGVISYGFSTLTSYAYPGGQALTPVANVEEVQIDVIGSTQVIGDQTCVQAIATDFQVPAQPVEGVRLDFLITAGPNAGLDGFAFTDSNGQATLCYTSTEVGTDTVQGKVSNKTDSDTVLWTPKEVTVSITADDRAYNGGDVATLNSIVVNGLLAAHAGQVSATASSATFDDKNVANGKEVTGTGLALTGPKAYNYTLTTTTATTTASVTPLPITATVLADDKPYDGTTTATVHSCALVGVLGNDDVSCSVNPVGTFDTAAVGTGKSVSVTGFTISGLDAGNYTVPVEPTAMAAITPRPILLTADSQVKVYGDSVTLTGSEFTVTGGLVGADTITSVTLTTAGGAPTATVAGSPYTITPSAAVGTNLGNYDITYFAGTFTVTQRPLTVTADSQAKTYGDAVAFVGTEFTLGGSGLVNGDTLTAVSLASAGAPATASVAGSPYAITPSAAVGTGLANYAISYVDGVLTVAPRAIAVAADPQTKVYGEIDPALTYQVTSGSLVGGDALTGAVARVAGEDVGTYAIQQGSLTAGPNYALTFTGANFTITPRPLTVAADPQSKIYGEVDPALTYQITAGTLFGGDTLTGSLSRAAGELVGTYGIQQGTVTAGSNYALTYQPADLVITPRAIEVTAAPQTKVYGDADPVLTYQLTGGTLVNGDTLTGSLTRAAGELVGTYPISQGGVSAGANYALTYVGASLTITPRPLTVTADPQTKVYGDADPALTFTLTSGTLVGADTLSGALTRAAGEAVGSYAIGRGTVAANGNYTLTYVPADLTITPRPITVTADPQTKVYGSADPTFTYQVTGGTLVNGDTLSGGLTRVPGEAVATYAIQQGSLTAGANYTVTYVEGELEITPLVIVVTADPQTKVYGDTDPALTYQLTGGTLVNGDTLSGSLARVSGEAVGLYGIEQGGLTAGPNYTLTYVGANLEITPLALTVTADAQT
ncbi:MAG: MBG domain-containing protein [Vicinamibacterales bacterium]